MTKIINAPPRVMTGATEEAAGRSGYAPTPGPGDQNKVLHGDGTFRPVTGAVVVPADGAFRVSSDGKFIQLLDASTDKWRSIWFDNGDLQYGPEED
jgi:hypothetical protein